MKLPAPSFHLARVYDDGRHEAEIVPITDLPLDVKTGRRGFLGAGVTAASVLGAVGCAGVTKPAQRLPAQSPAMASDPRSPAAGRVLFSLDCKGGVSHKGTVTSLAVSPGARMLASGSEDNLIKLWSLPEGVLQMTLDGHKSEVNALAISPSGGILASGSRDNFIKLWSLPEGVLLKTLDGHKDHVLSLAISPDGKILASGSRDNSIKLWSLLEGNLLRTLDGHTENVSALAISSDSRVLASGSWDNSIKLWSLPDGSPLKSLEGHKSDINALAISPDNRILASGSRDNSIMLWSIVDNIPPKTLNGQGGRVNALAISPDGRILASGRWGNTIELWNLPEGDLLKTLEGHGSDVNALAISLDSRILASGSRDKSIKLWSLPDGNSKACLIDLAASPSDAKGVTYQWRNEYGQLVTYTMPCGSPIPVGAVCTCNCVPGAIRIEPSIPTQTVPAPTLPYRGGGTICTCVPVCTCMAVPICQAHRVRDPDPLVRCLAKQLLLLMGRRELSYMDWAAKSADIGTANVIRGVMTSIRDGAKADPACWPPMSACLARTLADDEVVAVMAAQIATTRACRFGEDIPAAARPRIDSLLAEARRRPWYVRYGVPQATAGRTTNDLEP